MRPSSGATRASSAPTCSRSRRRAALRGRRSGPRLRCGALPAGRRPPTGMHAARPATRPFPSPGTECRLRAGLERGGAACQSAPRQSARSLAPAAVPEAAAAAGKAARGLPDARPPHSSAARAAPLRRGAVRNGPAAGGGEGRGGEEPRNPVAAARPAPLLGLPGASGTAQFRAWPPSGSLICPTVRRRARRHSYGMPLSLSQG